MRRRIFLFLGILTLLAAGLAVDEFKFPVKSGSVRFAAIGDMGTGESPQYEVAQQMLKAHEAFPFEFVIMLGDNIYGGSTPADFDKKFAVPYKPLLDAGVRFYASLGNHDNTNERFFVLNSNYMDPKQLAWLEGQLKDAGNGGWKICYFHHPLYSSGQFHGPLLDLRKLLEPLFVKYGVDVVFSGHDHVYERIRPQQGIYYFMEGASGELRPGNLARTAITEKGFDTDRSFVLSEIAGDDMYFETISRTGETVDSGVIHRTIR